MKKNSAIHLFVFLTWFIGISFIPLKTHAQETRTVLIVNDREVDFRRALRLYRSEDYLKAFAGFESLSNSTIIHHRMTACLLMTGKSLYHLEKFFDAIRYSGKLIDTFSGSRYVDDAYFLKAHASSSEHIKHKTLLI